MTKEQDIEEIEIILKEHGLSRDERRKWISKIRKEAKL